MKADIMGFNIEAEGFDSPRLHQIKYHLLIKDILSVGGFLFVQKSSNTGLFRFWRFAL